ncbi:hypothetical protein CAUPRSCDRAFT_10262 [Caulochytrium protostelioides]|uniref:Uncharacterized protein n=1 Tax=Caulochytrium protostelioides TaxID=1555241 RepID=A0A4P9X0E8_9FUNG|nr:hypothetical protein CAUPRSCDRAFT_10262 [Caulochytrium protostelioides]
MINPNNLALVWAKLVIRAQEAHTAFQNDGEDAAFLALERLEHVIYVLKDVREKCQTMTRQLELAVHGDERLSPPSSRTAVPLAMVDPGMISDSAWTGPMEPEPYAVASQQPSHPPASHGVAHGMATPQMSGITEPAMRPGSRSISKRSAVARGRHDAKKEDADVDVNAKSARLHRRLEASHRDARQLSIQSSPGNSASHRSIKKRSLDSMYALPLAGSASSSGVLDASYHANASQGIMTDPVIPEHISPTQMPPTHLGDLDLSLISHMTTGGKSTAAPGGAYPADPLQGAGANAGHLVHASSAVRSESSAVTPVSLETFSKVLPAGQLPLFNLLSSTAASPYLSSTASLDSSAAHPVAVHPEWRRLGSEMRSKVDEVFFEFLARLCTQLDARTTTGESIHAPHSGLPVHASVPPDASGQLLITKADHPRCPINEFCLLVFYPAAFSQAFGDALLKYNFNAENGVTTPHVYWYLHQVLYIDRRREPDLWCVQGMQTNDGAWRFRQVQRRFIGPPPVAIPGRRYEWHPVFTDPRVIHCPAKVTARNTPAWLNWDEAMGTLSGHVPVHLKPSNTASQKRRGSRHDEVGSKDASPSTRPPSSSTASHANLVVELEATYPHFSQMHVYELNNPGLGVRLQTSCF